MLSDGRGAKTAELQEGGGLTGKLTAAAELAEDDFHNGPWGAMGPDHREAAVVLGWSEQPRAGLFCDQTRAGGSGGAETPPYACRL